MTWRIVFLCAFAGVAVAAEIARPGATAADWLANAEAAAKAAGATAKTLDGIGAVAWGAIGVAALGALRVLAPLIPGGGPLVKMAADAVWAMMAHKDQKAADDAAAVLSRAVAQAAPVLDALRSLPPGSLPPDILRLLDSPITVQALNHLADRTAVAA
jgi:hypothetical protein